jgi:hypothetical protein
MSPGSAPLTKRDPARVEGGEIGDGRVRADLAVDAVAGFEADVLALADFENRCDVGMIAVVAGLRFGGERLGAVDADGVHAMGPSGEHRRTSLHCRAFAVQPKTL